MKVPTLRWEANRDCARRPEVIVDCSSGKMKGQQRDQRDAAATIGLDPPLLAVEVKKGSKDPRIAAISKSCKQFPHPASKKLGTMVLHL